MKNIFKIFLLSTSIFCGCGTHSGDSKNPVPTPTNSPTPNSDNGSGDATATPVTATPPDQSPPDPVAIAPVGGGNTGGGGNGGGVIDVPVDDGFRPTIPNAFLSSWKNTKSDGAYTVERVLEITEPCFIREKIVAAAHQVLDVTYSCKTKANADDQDLQLTVQTVRQQFTSRHFKAGEQNRCRLGPGAAANSKVMRLVCGNFQGIEFPSSLAGSIEFKSAQ